MVIKKMTKKEELKVDYFATRRLKSPASFVQSFDRKMDVSDVVRARTNTGGNGPSNPGNGGIQSGEIGQKGVAKVGGGLGQQAQFGGK